MRLTRITSFIFLMTCAMQPALAQGSAALTADVLTRIDSAVQAEMTKQKIPGVSVGIVRHGAVALAKGYGMANVELASPAEPETMFQSGSLGKQFTAAVLMLQVEDGKVRLDDPIIQYFPDAPASWRRITVRHLLTHTSGLADYTNSPKLDYRKDYTEDQLVHLCYKLPIEFTPGSRWRYSNTGYLLLGAIIRRASGMFYGDVLRDRIFGPAGMKTARIISESDIVPHRAAGYHLVNGELKNQEWVAPTINTTADGSLYVSVNDLIAWDAAIRRGALLRKSSWDQIYTPATLNSGARYDYGFGWYVDTVGGELVHRHTGSWQGFKTALSRYLGSDLTIIALANLGDAHPSIIVQKLAAIIEPHLAQKENAPISDADPTVTARVRTLLDAAARGTLAPKDFVDPPTGFFPDGVKEYRSLLGKLGTPTRLELLERRKVGDDQVYRYRARYGDRAMQVELALAPGGKVAGFDVEPQ